MIDWIEKELTNLAKFLKSYMYPFATTFFAILNYSKMKDILLKYHHESWAMFAFILSIIYILFTLGFAIFWFFNP